MKLLSGKIGVIFDESHLKTYNLNGIELVRATSWVAREDDGETGTKKETNVNHLETNPQLGLLAIENENFPYKLGDMLFLHYLAYEWSDERVPVDGQDAYLVDGSMVLFTIENGTLKMPEKAYLGELVVDEAPKTPSGIFLTSAEDVQSQFKIKITHIPESSICEVGEIVCSIDKHNYPVEYDGKKYVFIKEDEILGVMN